jgi:hypothetical protein
MRASQYMVEVIPDGFRLDAAKHIPMVLERVFDTAVFNRRVARRARDAVSFGEIATTTASFRPTPGRTASATAMPDLNGAPCAS